MLPVHLIQGYVKKKRKKLRGSMTEVGVDENLGLQRDQNHPNYHWNSLHYLKELQTLAQYHQSEQIFWNSAEYILIRNSKISSLYAE